MVYEVIFLGDARASIKAMSPDVARRIERMRRDLAGDVKRLKAHVPNYRLRIGDWRVLFEVDGRAIIIHDLKHRSRAHD